MLYQRNLKAIVFKSILMLKMFSFGLQKDKIN